MDQPLHGLPVDVSDEVTCPKAGLVGWASIFHTQDHVVDRVDVTVAHVDADGLQGEAVLLPGAVDDDGGAQAAEAEGQVPAGGGVPGGGVGGEGTGRDGTWLEPAGHVICSDDERQGRYRGRFGDLPPTGKPLSVWCFQLVPEASGCVILGRGVLRPRAVAADPDPLEV